MDFTKHDGIIYLETVSGKFFQTREYNPINETMFCGEFCEGYFQCQFTPIVQELSMKFLNKCLRISGAIDTVPNIYYDGDDWIIKKAKTI